jgi:hypothetical protein
MTPLQIRMMLHYYCIAAPYAEDDPPHRSSPVVGAQRQDLIDLGLLESRAGCPSGFGCTERGVAYVEGLQAMPLPEKVWVIPVRTST